MNVCFSPFWMPTAYSLEEYGFDENGVYRDHQDYMVHYGFGIPEKNLKPA
jgi:hypothetical protein